MEAQTGAGAAGEEWAGRHGLPVRRFPADWARHGKKAGPIRNRIMAEYAGAVVPFPGGRGTENMHNDVVYRQNGHHFGRPVGTT